MACLVLASLNYSMIILPNAQRFAFAREALPKGEAWQVGQDADSIWKQKKLQARKMLDFEACHNSIPTIPCTRYLAVLGNEKMRCISAALPPTTTPCCPMILKPAISRPARRPRYLHWKYSLACALLS